MYSLLLFNFILLARGEYSAHTNKNTYNGHGSIEIDGNGSAPEGLSIEQCQKRCDEDNYCDCVTFQRSNGKCWKRASCIESMFADGQNQYDTYVRISKPEPFRWLADIVAQNGGSFRLEAKTYYIDKQYQLPANTQIFGAGSGGSKTVIKAIGLQVDGTCNANVVNRKGLILGDNTYVGGLHFIGMDKERYSDNQLLCGGAAFETPGCVGTGQFTDPPHWCGGDLGIGRGISNATLEDITIERLTVQSVVYVSPTKSGVSVSKGITVKNIRTKGTWADGMNIHGAHQDILIQDCVIKNSGDDNYAIWSIGYPGADNIRFINNVGVNPWYRPGGSSAQSGWSNTDNCFASYGGRTMTFTGNSCSGGHDAVVIFGNDMHKTYGGRFFSDSVIRVEGNSGMSNQCYFGVNFPGAKIGCGAPGPAPTPKPGPYGPCSEMLPKSACDHDGCHSCGSRIQWLEQNRAMTPAQAFAEVAKEFPGICQCDDTPTKIVLLGHDK